MNGEGKQTLSWADYSECMVVFCDSGFNNIENNCILLDIPDIYIWTGNQVIWTNEYTDYEIFLSLLEKGNFKQYHPSEQPSNASWDYIIRSETLNDYLKDNNFYFREKWNITHGHLYLKLKKPTENEVFLYFHNDKTSWRIDKKSSLKTPSNDTYLFPLTWIALREYPSYSKIAPYNFQKRIGSNQLTFIGGYVAGFDWNQIEEITISWE